MASYVAPSGKFLLVESYLGEDDKTVVVSSPQEAVTTRSGLSASLDCVGAGEFASYALYNDQGEKVSF